jgi:hypothetical protein
LQGGSVNLSIMKTPRKPQRSINSLSSRRWTAYMTAAAASTLAGAGSAEAEIHYSGDVSIELTGNAHASLPLSNGASLVFQNFFESTFIQTFTFVMKGVTSGSGWGSRYFPGSVRLSNVPRGVNVSAGRFLPVTGNPDHGVLFTNWSDGQFAADGPPVRGWIGFRFNTGRGIQYGWARIRTRSESNNQVHDLIKDYAWGDVGDTIFTGQTHSFQPADAHSVVGFLGLLAFGAQGLDAWRAPRLPKSN